MLFKKLQRWWGIICMLGMLIPAISQAQCVYPGSNISFARTGQNTSAGYTTRYVLTTTSGIIISVYGNSTTAISSPNQAGTYRIYAVNYQTANAPTLAPGINISTITTSGACAALSAPLEFCVNDICVLPGSSITFTNAGNNTTSGYSTIYALVNAATGNIIQQVTSPFTAPAAMGSYQVYAINYQGTAPALTPGNNISTVNGSCVSKSTEPMQFSICAPATISGNVFNDVNGNTLLESGENFTTMPGTMYMHLVDYNGIVLGVTTVAANGSYSLAAGQGQDYSLMLSPVSYAIGTSVGTFAIDQSLPAGWVRTGENLGNTGTGDGYVDGWLEVTVPASTSTVTNANFGMTKAGYIYVHKATLDESSSVDFTFNITGGPTAVASFALNDRPEQMNLRDIGASQSGRLWAINNSTSQVFYRDAGSSRWQVTSIVNASRIDGGQGNSCYVVTTAGTVIFYSDLSGASTIYTGNNATDVGSDWTGRPYIIANGGQIYQYSGTGSGTAGSAAWTRVGTSANNYRIDGNPSNGNMAVLKTDDNIYTITASGVETNLGKAAGTGVDPYDVAVDVNGVIFGNFDVNFGGYVSRWTGSAWSALEVTSRKSQAITAGLGGQVWSIVGGSGASLLAPWGNIFTRTYDGTNIFWIDDERVRTSPSNGNSMMVAVVPGTYSIAETVPSGWSAQAITVYDPTANSSSTVSTASASINVAPGEVVNVLFQNGLVRPFTMTSDCNTVYKEDFGTGSVGSVGGALIGQTNYHYLSSATEAGDDGQYKVIGRTSDFAYWATQMYDHTSGDGTGRMMVVNASYDRSEFFRRRFTGVIPGAVYDFSAWIASFSGGIRPNVQFKVIDHTTGNVLATVSSGNINDQAVWHKTTLSFTATTSSIDLVLQNNAIGGDGNDLALDDIEFRINQAAPTTTVTYVNCGAVATIKVTAPLGAGFEYRMDGGSWQTSTDFVGVPVGNHTIYSRLQGTTNCERSVVETVKAVICGNVFNDANGNTEINSGENFSSLPAPLYVYLVNSSGIVVDSAHVAANGTYSLEANPGQNYTLHLSNVSYPNIIGADTLTKPVSKALPAGWVNTGENLSGTNDGVINGILPVAVGTSNISNANFGIEQRPVAGSGTASMINQNGTAQHTVPATAFTSNANSTDAAPGNVASIRITGFPAGANSIVINGTTYTTTGTGGTTVWPAGGVTVPTDGNGKPTQTITVDPAANDATQVVISFVAIDNAGVESSNTGTATINFIADPIRSGNNVVAGTVYNDYDGPANGINNLSGATISGLNAVLVGDDGLGNQVVYGVTPVSNADGSFQFLNVPDGNFTVVITTQNPAVRDPAPTSQLPTGWLHTGENWGGGTGNDGLADGIIAISTMGGVDAVDVEFGIRQNVSLDLGNLPIAGSGAPVIWPQASATLLSLDLTNTNRAWLGDNNSYPNQANVSNANRNGGLTLSSDDIDLSGTGASNNPFVFAGIDWRQANLDLKFNITVNGNASAGDRTVYYGLWFDANGNGSFTDADDIFVTGSQAYGGPVTVTVPASLRNGGTNAGANSGAIRLVATKENTIFTKAQNGNVNVINGEVEDYFINYPTVLPVNIALFTVIKQNNEAVLNWTTASEQNNRGFYVERSTDGVNWTSLGFVNSKATNGNSNAKLSYAFTDKQPAATINYYRLKQTDVDNKVGYSEIRQLDFNNSVSLVKIYPNPAKSVFNITGVEAGSTIRVEDALGKTILLTVRTGTIQSVSTIDISRFPQGIYMVTVYKKDGTTVTRKLIKE